MNRRSIAAMAVLAVAGTLAISACAPSATVGSTTVDAARTVNVSTTGSAEAVPDAAKASITVEVTNPTSAQTAQADAAAATTKVLDALKAAAIDPKDIATQSLQVQPTYNYTSDGGQQLTGYRASQSIQVTLRDLAKAGATLDSLVQAGGNAVRIDSLSPYVTDPTVAQSAARAQAVEMAQKQAEQYAKLLGFELGAVASVTESTNNVAPPPIAYADAAPAPAGKAPTPIEPGTQTVQVSLSIAWEIKK